MTKAVFLDRDGVINIDKAYVLSSLESVSFVVLFEKDTSLDKISWSKGLKC